jgi:hypothetical protein
MNSLILICVYIAVFFIGLYIVDKIDKAEEKQEFQKWKRISKVDSYRIHITCNNIIMIKTFTGDNYSEILEKTINYSLKEMDGFPDVMIIKRDIIYL